MKKQSISKVGASASIRPPFLTNPFRWAVLSTAIAATAMGQTPGTYQWNQNPAGATTFTWTNTANWTPTIDPDGRLFPNFAGDIADLSQINLTGTGTSTINLGTDITIGTLYIGDSTSATQGYVIGGDAVAKTLTFDNGVSNAVITQVAGSGATTISALVQLTSDLDFTNLATARNFTLTGALSGSGDLNITSGTAGVGNTSTSGASGALEIGAAVVNSFTGNFNIAGGALMVSNDGNWGDSTTGTRVMTLSNNAMLMNRTGYTLGANRQLVVSTGGGRLRTFSGQTITFGTAGQLAGTGTLNQIDSGTVAITAANAGFTGGYLLSVGTLNASASGALGSAAVTVAGGTLNASVAGALGTGAFSASGGTTTITGAQTSSSFSVSGGTVTAIDPTVYVGNVPVANSPLGSGVVTLSGGTTNLRVNGSADATAQTLTLNNTLALGGTAVAFNIAPQVAGGTFKTIAFNGTNFGATSLNASGNSTGYTLALGPVTLTATGGGSSTINPNNTIWVTASDVTGTATAGFTNTLVLGGSTTSVGSAITGAITDGAGGGIVALARNNTGTWALTGNTSNTYSGSTTLTNGGLLTLQKTGGAIAIPGILNLDATITNNRVEIGTVATAGTIGQQFGPNAVLNFVNNTASLHAYVKLFGNNQTVAGLSELVQDGGVVENSQTEAFSTNAVLTINNSADYSFAGFLRNNSSTGTGTLGLTKTGAGKQTLVGSRITYTGATTINQGTLELSGATGFVSAVDFGAGSAGTLQITSATQGIGALSTTDATNLNAIVQNAAGTNSVLAVTQATNTSFGGRLRDNAGGNTLGLTKAGAGTLALNTANTYTGPTTLTAGTLQLGAPESGGSGPLGSGGTIAFGGGTLRHTAANTFDYSSRFSTAATQLVSVDTNGQNVTFASNLTSTGGSLTKLGTGTLTLTGANTYTGATTIALGTLNAAGTSAANGILTVGNTAGNAVLNVVTSMTGSQLSVGAATGSSGAVNLSTGTTLALSAPENTDVSAGFGAANGGYGALNMSGGTFTHSRFQFGGVTASTAAGGIGVGLISDGTVNSNGWMILARAGASTGILTITGGLINHTSAVQNIHLGLAGTGRAELNVAGGTIDNTGRNVSYSGGGFTWTGTGIVNMNAGTLITNGFAYGSGTALLNFNGGTIKAGAANASYLSGLTAAHVNGAFGTYAGGAVFDTNGFAITVAQPLLAPTGNGVTTVAITAGGSGYIGAPAVLISGTGTGATAIANMVDDGTGNGTLRVGSITITNPGVNYTGTPTFTLAGGGATAVATPGAVGIGANTSGGLTKTGNGTLSLSGVNTYTGPTVVNTGTLAFANTASQTLPGIFSGAGSVAQSGTGTTTLTGTISLGSLLASAGTLAIVGTTNLNSTPVTVNGGTFDLGGTTQSLSLFTLSSGTITNGSLTGTSFLKQGNGALNVGASVTGMSTVTINQGITGIAGSPATLGPLNLNFAATGAPAANVFNSTAALNLGGPATSLSGGGALAVTGVNSVANSQTFASTLVDAGASSLALTAAATPGSVALNLGTLTRNAGGTVDIILPAGTQSSANGVTLANPGTAGTLLTSSSGTAFATVSGNDWAANSSDSPGNIVGASMAGAGGASLYTTATNAGTFTGNADITGSFTASTGATVNSIRFNAGTSLTLTLVGVNTVGTGGVLVGTGITTGATITGGSIRPGAGREMVFINNETNAALGITSVIANSADGESSVTFRGNPSGGIGGLFNVSANNTYTGPTYITSGRVNVAATGVTTPFGTGANAIVYVNGNTDGQFFSGLNSTFANPFVIIGTGFNENGTRRGALRLDSSATNTPTLSGPITLLGDASIGNNSATTAAGFSLISGDIGTSNSAGATSFALTKVMTGVLRITGNNSQTATNINSGILSIDADAALGSSSSPVTFTGNSALQVHTTAVIPATRTLVVPAGIVGSVDPFGGDISFNATITGTGTFAKSGTGKITFGGALHSGLVAVDQGTLAFATEPNIPNTITFGSLPTTTTAGTLDLTGQNAAFGGLVAQTNTATASTVLVDSGKTLAINGNISIGSTSNNATTVLNVSGAGALAVNSPGGSVRVGVGPTATNVSSKSAFDLSGLATFIANVGAAGNVTVGVNGDNNAARVNTATFKLANTSNTITAGTLTVGGSATGVQNALVLGSGTNVFNIDAWNVGTGTRDGGAFTFQTASGTVSVASISGGRVPLNVGTGGATTGFDANNLIDTTGHTANLFLGAVTVGTQSRSSSAILSSQITFNQGTLDMTSLTMSTRTSGTNVGTNTSTLNIGGGEVDIQNGILQFGQVTTATTGAIANATLTVTGGTVDIGATSGVAIRTAAAAVNNTANATLTFSGGTTTLAGDIIRSGGTGATTTTLTVSGGTLDLGNNDIGDLTNPVTAVLESGTLRNVAQINGGAAVTKTGTGTLTLAGTNTYSGLTTVSAGTLLVSGSLSGAVTVSSTATVGGAGTIVGAVTLNTGASLAPGASPGTLNTGALTFDSGTFLKVELAQPGVFGLGINDLVSVTGALTLDGMLNITPLSGFGEGTYRLINYTGALTNNEMLIDPLFLNAYPDSSINIANGGAVDLIVAIPEPASVFSIVAGCAVLLGRRRRRAMQS